MRMLSISVADPHHLDADPVPAFQFDADVDPDPTFHSDADPDPIFQFDADSDLATLFSQNLYPLVLQNDPLRLTPFHIHAAPDPEPNFTLMRIRIRILLPKMMRIRDRNTAIDNLLRLTRPKCS
jgi:hypothetical protein